MKAVIFWGATGQARVLHDAIQGSDYTLEAIFDNRSVPSPFPGVRLMVGREGFSTWQSENARLDQNTYACVAIGGSRGAERVELQAWLEGRGLRPLTVIHPRAFVAEGASVGPGSQILCMAAVCANARLGRAVIVNTAATVDHDCVLGDGVHVAPGAHLAGDVHVEDYVFIGMGALVLPRVRIGRGAVVGAGAVVTRNVDPGETVVGIPARPIQRTLTQHF